MGYIGGENINQITSLQGESLFSHHRNLLQTQYQVFLLRSMREITDGFNILPLFIISISVYIIAT